MFSVSRTIRLPVSSNFVTLFTASIGTKGVKNEIEIPKRINRSSTDILYALASTVKRDPTAPDFKYHDDPYLTPTSNVGKRVFALAQESGRKAAKWVKDQHGDLFQHSEAQPPIKDFCPKIVFNEDSQVDELTLLQLINDANITDAVLVYELIKKKNLEITKEMKQSLLELICFYNNEEPIPFEFIEERWFNQNMTRYDRNKKTWKDGDLAEKIFAEMEPKTPEAYIALIRGMAKCNQSERAYALFQEALDKQLSVDTKTFNSIIAISKLLRESADLRWSLVLDLLREMNQRQLKPDVGTLNSVLETISSFGNYKLARSCALNTLSEFKKVGVEPSLGTYYYILIIFCRERSPVSHVIADILHEIGTKEFKIADPKDTHFFATAMDICRNHLHDSNLAKKVNALLHIGNNYDLIGNSYKEMIYYRNLVGILCETEPLDKFMETYDFLVPNIYVPEPGIMEEILKAIEINGASNLVPRIWSDLVIFDYTNRESLVVRILSIMVNNRTRNSEPINQGPSLDEQFATVALDIYNKVNGQKQNRGKTLSFTGHMLGDILILLVRGENFEKACEVFTNIDRNQDKIPGTPSEACLLEFVDACILNKSPSQAITCLQYCVDSNLDSIILAQKINQNFTLNEAHLSKIKALVGDDFTTK